MLVLHGETLRPLRAVTCIIEDSFHGQAMCLLEAPEGIAFAHHCVYIAR